MFDISNEFTQKLKELTNEKSWIEDNCSENNINLCSCSRTERKRISLISKFRDVVIRQFDKLKYRTTIPNKFERSFLLIQKKDAKENNL